MKVLIAQNDIESDSIYFTILQPQMFDILSVKSIKHMIKLFKGETKKVYLFFPEFTCHVCFASVST